MSDKPVDNMEIHAMSREVPFCGQHITENTYERAGFATYEEAKHWENRSCGVVCLQMALDFLRPGSKVSTKELIDEGVAIGAYKPGVGWIHQGLVDLAVSHGLKGGRESVGGH